MSDHQSSINKEGEESKKLILLDLSRTERAFEESESLWDIEIEKIEDRLKDHIASLNKYGGEMDLSKKPLLSIAILGYPGSGKTSMLHTLVERVKNENRKSEGLKNVYSLPVIKPNLVAQDDHFLYAFLAEALRMDRQQHANDDDPDRETQIISRVQHKFQDVSEYLQVLNQTGHKHEGDPLGVSLERLDRHESGLMLIEKMAEFIDELADSLGRGSKESILLLPVDDADMSQEILISALDTCWRFIKHPRLVPIFTFTGRLAEELMRVNYDKKLNSEGSSEKLMEAATSMLVTENMAIQHLGKLFPVRNRIKMGPAAARVQVAKYKPLKDGPGKKEGNEVSDLLKKASILLFGHPQLYHGHSIRPPLRMVTLRRQIQIVDAIQGTGIEQFMGGVEKPKSWAVIFDLATWSLLNAHRDVLKEIHLNLDDLYSWTPKGLRQVILDSILIQKKDNLAKLHKQWRYRSDDRRSQIISLLAVNVFRPRMDEEPTEDDIPEIIAEWWGNNKDSNDKRYLTQISNSFPVIKGALWFLNLCIGFFLPQVISNWNRLSDQKEKCSDSERVTGIGWGLMSGPLHAVKEALKKKKVFSSGILFLDPIAFDKQIKDGTHTINKRFFSHIWCYYGFDGEWPWAAISLWRGLGLMGKVIEVFVNDRKNSDGHSNCIAVDSDNGNDRDNLKYELKNKIEKVIRRHFESARVYSKLPKGEEIPDNYQELLTENWEYKNDGASITGTGDNLETKIPDFAEAMISWLKENCSTFIKMKKKDGEEDVRIENRIMPMETDEDWESCFIRRLHGDDLMGKFWQDLENSYFKKNLKDWTAILVLSQWKTILNQYWKGCTQIKSLFESCPIWPDFKSQGNIGFSWGESKGLNENDEVQKDAGIKRLFLEDYGLFKDDEKPSNSKVNGNVIVPNESKKSGDDSNVTEEKMITGKE
jgi:hypothetical protein